VQKETLKYVLAENTSRKLPIATPRALQPPLSSNKVVTLVGIRRSGKTYILYETMRRLEAQGVDRRQILYLNFEDDRLLPLKSRELDLILRAHAELYPSLQKRKNTYSSMRYKTRPAGRHTYGDCTIRKMRRSF
jgi:predicted AAA+ superfamily ATPase